MSRRQRNATIGTGAGAAGGALAGAAVGGPIGAVVGGAAGGLLGNKVGGQFARGDGHGYAGYADYDAEYNYPGHPGRHHHYGPEKVYLPRSPRRMNVGYKSPRREVYACSCSHDYELSPRSQARYACSCGYGRSPSSTSYAGERRDASMYNRSPRSLSPSRVPYSPRRMSLSSSQMSSPPSRMPLSSSRMPYSPRRNLSYEGGRYACGCARGCE